MAALTTEFKLVNLSFIFDAITIYPTFEYYKNPNLRNCLDVALGECNDLNFVIKLRANEEPTKENNDFLRSLNCLMKDQKDQTGYQRIIRRNDDDHALYHRDNFKLNDSHWHIKFRNLLSKAQVKEVLSIFVRNQIMSESESDCFLKELDKRYQMQKNDLNALLSGNKQEDTDKIISFIEQCYENDILVQLHDYLLSPKFNYLRDASENEKILWQGSDANNQIVPTSEAWARIEKALTLKIEMNIQTECSKFTKSLCKERASQFASELGFFAIKRKQHTENSPSKIFTHFQEGDGDFLKDKCKDVFKC